MDLQHELIREIAKRHNITMAEVDFIYKEQFRFVHKTMQEGEDKSVMLPYFGKFCVKPNRRRLLNETIEKSKKQKQERLAREKLNQENAKEDNS